MRVWHLRISNSSQYDFCPSYNSRMLFAALSFKEKLDETSSWHGGFPWNCVPIVWTPFFGEKKNNFGSVMDWPELNVA